MTNEIQDKTRSAEQNPSASPALPLADRSSQDRSVAAAGSLHQKSEVRRQKSEGAESTIGGRSVRSVIALLLIGTLCAYDLARLAAAIWHNAPVEPALIRDLALVAMSYFFTRQTTPTPQA